MKTCTRCKTEKHFTEFSKNRRSKDGLCYACKSCDSNYYQSNKDRLIAYQAKYYESNREKIRSYLSNYRALNSEKISAYYANYSSLNPEKIKARGRNRIARKRKAEGSHSDFDVLAIFSMQRGLCANCKSRLLKSGKKKFHVDHIMPLALGGSNWPSNLQCLCPACNLKKNAKDPVRWANENGRLI